MSKENINKKVQGIEKICFWENFDSDEPSEDFPCLDNNVACKYSSIKSEKAQMYLKACKYFNNI